jgi:hypothetical protein
LTASFVAILRIFGCHKPLSRQAQQQLDTFNTFDTFDHLQPPSTTFNHL